MTNAAKTPAPAFSAISSRMGIHVATTAHYSQGAAERAARKAIRDGVADSAAVWTATEAVRYFGSGR